MKSAGNALNSRRPLHPFVRHPSLSYILVFRQQYSLPKINNTADRSTTINNNMLAKIAVFPVRLIADMCCSNRIPHEYKNKCPQRKIIQDNAIDFSFSRVDVIPHISTVKQPNKNETERPRNAMTKSREEPEEISLIE